MDAYSAFWMFGFSSLVFAFSFSNFISTDGKIRKKGGQGRKNMNVEPPPQDG